MNSKGYLWCVVFLFGFLSSLPGEDVIVNINAYPPFAILDDERELHPRFSGILIDILDGFQEKFTNYRLQYLNFPNARAKKMAESGEGAIDIIWNSTLFASKELQSHYDYVMPITTTRDIIVTRKDSAFNFTKPEDLYGKTVGLILGYSYADFEPLFERGLIHSERVVSHEQNIKKLIEGRIDACFGNSHVSPYYIKMMGFDLSDYTFSEWILFEFDYGPYVTKTKPHLYADLYQYLSDINSSGELDRILHHYIN